MLSKSSVRESVHWPVRFQSKRIDPAPSHEGALAGELGASTPSGASEGKEITVINEAELSEENEMKTDVLREVEEMHAKLRSIAHYLR